MLRLSGDFDLLAVEPFEVEVDRVASTAQGHVVIDLRDLTFIDSSGLRGVLAAHERLTARGLSVSFLRPPEKLWRVFTVTGTDALLPFDDALASEVGGTERDAGA